MEHPVSIFELVIDFELSTGMRLARDEATLLSGVNRAKQMQHIIKNMLTEIRSTYGDLEVNEFGPGRFESYRQSLVAKGLAKHTVKRYSDYVKKMFQYDVKMEMIPVELNQSLLTCVGKRKRLKSRNAR